MRLEKTLTLVTLLIALPLQGAIASAVCPKPWVCEKLPLDIPFLMTTTSEEIRAGYYPEAGTFRGNILYFEGLGDSMLNHAPLFSQLSEAGFRVIAFDYMGQGGSTGRMSRTQIRTIPWIGERVWQKFARDLAAYPKKTLIGWSTGGLAAYLSATTGNVDQVVLIAPGIAPNTVVGEGVFHWPMNEITPESLTTAAPYSDKRENPHVDPIRPNSPLKVLPFALDLIATAEKMQKKNIPATVSGFVLLSGKDDTYVNAAKTYRVLARTAPHFQVKAYPGALHEIDNERLDIGRTARADIVNFLIGQ